MRLPVVVAGRTYILIPRTDYSYSADVYTSGTVGKRIGTISEAHGGGIVAAPLWNHATDWREDIVSGITHLVAVYDEGCGHCCACETSSGQWQCDDCGEYIPAPALRL